MINGTGFLFRDDETILKLFVVTIAQLRAYIKSHCIVYFKWVNFISRKEKGNSQAVHGLGLSALVRTARSGGSLPGQETKLPQTKLWAQQQQKKTIKKSNDGTSLVVQWLRLCTSTSRKGLGSIHFGEIRSYMLCNVAKKLKIRKKIK